MHTAIPVCEIMHMGIQDLISRMKIFPVCIRLVTKKSPYAYGDCASAMRSPYANGDLRDPHVHTGIDLDLLIHTGITCHVIPLCIRGFAQSPYAYRD